MGVFFGGGEGGFMIYSFNLATHFSSSFIGYTYSCIVFLFRYFSGFLIFNFNFFLMGEYLPTYKFYYLPT